MYFEYGLQLFPSCMANAWLINRNKLIKATVFYFPQLSGCFGTGRGRLNSTNVIVEFDTRVMTEDKT